MLGDGEETPSRYVPISLHFFFCNFFSSIYAIEDLFTERSCEGNDANGEFDEKLWSSCGKFVEKLELWS